MRVRALAGRLGPRTAGVDWPSRLERSIEAEGATASSTSGPLDLAWVPADAGASPGGDGVVCLVHGRPRARRLAAALAADPATPAERLIAAGYERIGERALDHVAGEFTLLVWDHTAERGVVARDRVGGGPMFFAEHRGALLFASEVRHLLALLPTRPAPDGVEMAHWLARTSPRHERTLYTGVHRLRAGHSLRISARGWSDVQRFVPRYEAPRRVSADQAAAELLTALRGAVERALEGVARPAVMLSGGFDSSTIAAMAHDLLGGERPPAYSTVFPGWPDVDEAARIARAREWIGLPGVEATFRSGSPLAAGIEYIRAWDLPSVTPNLFIWQPLLRRAASDGVDAVLDGEGGDELLGCAAFLVADLLRVGRVRGALRIARRLPGVGNDPPPRLLRRALMRFGLRPAIPYGIHERLRRPRQGALLAPWLTEAARVEQLTGDDPWAWKRNRGPRWWARLVDSVTAGPDTLGAPDHLRRAGALAGVELRHPLRDTELQDFVLGLPPEHAFDPNLDRALARRALAGALPPEILDDDTKPVFNPILSDSFEARDGAALRALLADPHPELARRVRDDAVARLLDGGRRPFTWSVDLWRIASLELWLEHLADGAALDRALDALDPAPDVSFAVRPVAG